MTSIYTKNHSFNSFYTYDQIVKCIHAISSWQKSVFVFVLRFYGPVNPMAEICEIRLIFRGDLTKFCEIFIKNHF